MHARLNISPDGDAVLTDLDADSVIWEGECEEDESEGELIEWLADEGIIDSEADVTEIVDEREAELDDVFESGQYGGEDDDADDDDELDDEWDDAEDGDDD